MEEIRIRKAEIDDMEAIYLLNRDELGYDYDLSAAKSRLQLLLNQPAHCILVAVLREEVVGYIHANDYDVLYSDSLKNIMGIAVSSRQKRKGIGKMLLTAVEEWARECGAAGIRLTSGSTRTGAHQFYQSCGYTKKKEQFNFSKIF